MIYREFLKPLFDKIMAIILLLFFLPVLILVALFIFLFMGRPIFFTQTRPGKDERLFDIYKFRTMSDDTDKNGEFLPDAQRLNGVGKFIRSTSLDELPQLFNVLKGDMSFVGPRPLLAEYLSLYNTKQKNRHKVKPGITGWAQVNGRNAISWKEKFELDVWYVKNQSFWLDMKILWLTFLKVLKRDGVSSSKHVTVEKFRGNDYVK